MPSLESVLVARLVATPALTALIGGATPRIYWKKARQGATYPYVTYLRVSGGPRTSRMGSDSGLIRPRYQFDAWAQALPGKGPHQVAAEVSEQIRLALERARGVAFSGVEVQDVFINGDRDLDNPEVETAGVSLDVLVWARETVP